jgi:hypothetical protein
LIILEEEVYRLLYDNRNTALFRLGKKKLIKKVSKSLDLGKSLSIVRVGDGENIVLSQYSILSEEEFMATAVGTGWPKHRSGVQLPNTQARDELVRALKKADIVGILPYGDSRVRAPEHLKRPLTDKIFNTYQIRPKKTFDAYLTRTILAEKKFWKTLKGKKIVIISSWAKRFVRKAKHLLKKYKIKVVQLFPIYSYHDYPRILQEVSHLRFDVALIGAGVAALPLATHIAKEQNTVALDLGKSFELVVKQKGLYLPGSCDKRRKEQNESDDDSRNPAGNHSSQPDYPETGSAGQPPHFGSHGAEL